MRLDPKSAKASVLGAIDRLEQSFTTMYWLAQEWEVYIRYGTKPLAVHQLEKFKGYATVTPQKHDGEVHGFMTELREMGMQIDVLGMEYTRGNVSSIYFRYVP